jgi:hypothetical protein
VTPAEEIEVLDPPRRTVRIKGEEIAVEPLSIGQVGPVQRVLDPMLAELRGESADPEAGVGESVIEFDLKQFIVRHTDEAIEIVAIAMERPRVWVAHLYIDEFIELARAVFEVNLDFFNRRLVASVARLTARLQAAAGSISSGISSQPDTTAGT